MNERRPGERLGASITMRLTEDTKARLAACAANKRWSHSLTCEVALEQFLEREGFGKDQTTAKKAKR